MCGTTRTKRTMFMISFESGDFDLLKCGKKLPVRINGKEASVWIKTASTICYQHEGDTPQERSIVTVDYDGKLYTLVGE